MTEFDSVIPAGGSGTLTAKMKTTPTQQGALSKSIAVTTDAPGADRLTLSMTFRAVPSVTVLPQPRIFLVGLLGERPSSTLVLHRGDERPMTVTGVDVSDPRLQVEVEPVTDRGLPDVREARAGDVRLVATVAPDTPAGTVNGRLTVHTDHPDAPTISVPFAIRMRAAIEARPERPVLVLQEGNSAGRTTLFRLQHNRGTPFRVTELVPSDPSLIRARLVDDGSAGQVHTVAVVLPDELLPGAFSGRRPTTLRVVTDDEETPQLTVDVMIESRQLRTPGAPRPLP